MCHVVLCVLSDPIQRAVYCVFQAPACDVSPRAGRDFFTSLPALLCGHTVIAPGPVLRTASPVLQILAEYFAVLVRYHPVHAGCLAVFPCQITCYTAAKCSSSLPATCDVSAKCMLVFLWQMTDCGYLTQPRLTATKLQCTLIIYNGHIVIVSCFFCIHLNALTRLKQ